MTWKLWLDDQLDDPETPERHIPEGFKGAKSSFEAMMLVEEFGLPSFMDLDFDLGFNSHEDAFGKRIRPKSF